MRDLLTLEIVNVHHCVHRCFYCTAIVIRQKVLCGLERFVEWRQLSGVLELTVTWTWWQQWSGELCWIQWWTFTISSVRRSLIYRHSTKGVMWLKAFCRMTTDEWCSWTYYYTNLITNNAVGALVNTMVNFYNFKCEKVTHLSSFDKRRYVA